MRPDTASQAIQPQSPNSIVGYVSMKCMVFVYLLKEGLKEALHIQRYNRKTTINNTAMSIFVVTNFSGFIFFLNIDPEL